MAYRNFNPRRQYDRGWTDRWAHVERESELRGYQPRHRNDRGESDDFERRGWREGSDYYGNRAERYGEPRHVGSFRDDRSADVWGGREESDERYRGHGVADAFGDFTPADYDARGYGSTWDYGSTSSADLGSRWSDENAGPAHRSDWRRDRDYWRDPRSDEQSARDVQRWRSDMLRFGGWGSLASAVGISEGEHRGRGPRGYRRSDERIREEVCEFLTDDPRVDASEIDVTVENGEVTLAGMVDSRDEKRRAEDLVESIAGVRDVHNRLRTNQPGLLERAADALRPHAG